MTRGSPDSDKSLNTATNTEAMRRKREEGEEVGDMRVYVNGKEEIINLLRRKSNT